MTKEEWEKKYENDDFGMNAKHGAEHPKCVDCKYRTIFEFKDGTVLDTGKSATCKKYKVLKPMDVLTKDNAHCPKYEKDDKE